jgi:hypothetical protein
MEAVIVIIQKSAEPDTQKAFCLQETVQIKYIKAPMTAPKIATF